MSYFLLQAINKNLQRKKGRYTDIYSDLENVYKNANIYFFGVQPKNKNK